ncbi:MAG: HdeD family acid-resistance protein, partial [Bauldia litoralis]
MSISLEAAAEVMRQAMRDTVRRHSLWYLIQGGLMILGGVLALLYPVISSVAVVALLGWVLIISGVVQGISIIGARSVPHFWLQLVSVVLSIIVGILFLSNPSDGLLTLTFLLIVFFMVEGMSKIIFALTIRPFPNWGWVLGSGVVGILISVFLLANMDGAAVWLLGVLLGIQLVAEGAALGYLAWQVRQQGKPPRAPKAPVAAPPPPPAAPSAGASPDA